jgi:hypothetical protein
MNRREFLTAATGGTLAMSFPAGAADGRPSIIELSYVRMRNTQDAMTQRTNDFLAKTYLPALRRAGAKQVGAFTNLVGEGNPATVLLSEYADAAAWEAATRKVREDKDAMKASDAYYGGPLQFVRMETMLFRGFPGMPNVEVPPARSDNKTHIFELRTYESNNPKTLARKIRMFDEGETALFRKVGMIPVFFGEALSGPNLPQLTYMVGYEDWNAREKAWATFVGHPEWDKMKNQPGVSDGEVVSSISNALLRPLPFSGIK